MKNMMNRFVEGRGHVREIDMLLELTYVASCSFVYHGRLPLLTVNKLRDELFVRSVMLPLGLFKV